MQGTELPSAGASVRSPLVEEGGADGPQTEIQRKQELLQQLPFEIEKGKGFFWGYDIAIYKCKGKVVKYGEIAVAKCIFSFPHTILVEGETWKLLTCLTVLCFLTMFFVIITGSAESMGISDVTGRVQLLLGFVLSGHVGQILSRWSQLRFSYFGPMWGGIENFCLLIDKIFIGNDSELARDMKQRSKRYCRLVMQLLFHAQQERDDLGGLAQEGLLLECERPWLQACPLGTRALLVVSWLLHLWSDLQKAGAVPEFNDTISGDSALLAIKGGIGGTMGMLGCPLPYAYVHVVYWTLQMLLSILAVETGTLLAIYLKRQGNGNGEYSFDDGSHEWPESSHVWYLNEFIQVTCGNVIFAVFTVGLLKVCDRLSNPFRDLETSFSSFLYDKALNNNVNAISAGLVSYAEIYPDRIPALPPSGKMAAAAAAAAAVGSAPTPVPARLAAWSPQQVADWAGRRSDDSYRGVGSGTDAGAGAGAPGAYYCSSPPGYTDCAPRLLARGVTGAVLFSLTEADLEADFGLADKYLRRAFMSDRANLRLQMA